MITLEVNGNRYDGFKEISVFRSIETISGSFSFLATSSQSLAFPIQANSACSIYVDNTQVINGYIDTLDVSYSTQQHSILIKGRDKTSDIIDSSIVDVKEFNGYGLVDILKKVLSDNNMSDVGVINNTGQSIAPFEDYSPASSPTGQTIFNFIESYARKRQILLTTDGLGNIVLTRSATGTPIANLQNVINGQFNNIKSATASYDYTQRFNTYVLNSSQDAQGFAFEDDIDYNNIASQKGTAIDSSIRASRRNEMIAETSDTNQNLNQLATWTSNLSKARSIEYTATVQGYYSDSTQTQLWQPNTLIKVDDDFADIRSTMLVKSVVYGLSNNEGSTTEITLVDKDVYTIQASVDAATIKSNNTGNEYNFSE